MASPKVSWNDVLHIRGKIALVKTIRRDFFKDDKEFEARMNLFNK